MEGEDSGVGFENWLTYKDDDIKCIKPMLHEDG
jgi:hypothetical protein